MLNLSATNIHKLSDTTNHMKKISKVLEIDDVKIIIFIVFVIFACEMMIRGFATELSGNINHIETFPETAFKIAGSNKKSVLFLGNSLTGNAINPDVFTESASESGVGNVNAYKFVPDATAIWDWYCIVKNEFTANNEYPDVVINGFAWWLLSDQERPEPSRLGGYFCDISDITDLYQSGMKDQEDIIKYYLSSGSLFFTNRDLIKKRFLEKIIFSYQTSVQKMNERENYRGISVINIKTYQLLKKYMALLKSKGVEMVFISMPVKDDYDVDEELVAIFDEYGAQYFDYRHLSEITSDLFIDPIHLGTEGSRIFTMKLAADYSDKNL